MTQFHLSALNIHPLKSARALPRSEATIEAWGLIGDRRWMLVNERGQFISQRSHPRLAQVEAEPTVGDAGLVLAAPNRPPLAVAAPTGPTTPVQLWQDTVEVVPAAESASSWLSDWLDDAVSLVYLDDPSLRREVDQTYGRPGEMVGFADGYPILITTTASLAALNHLISAGDRPAEGPLPMNRFRPNLVIDGTAPPWAEDGWEQIQVGDVVLRIVKPCGRCAITTTDQQTAERGREPLRTLGRHRKIDRRLVFGQNAVPERVGVVRVGDAVRVLS